MPQDLKVVFEVTIPDPLDVKPPTCFNLCFSHAVKRAIKGEQVKVSVEDDPCWIECVDCEEEEKRNRVRNSLKTNGPTRPIQPCED